MIVSLDPTSPMPLFEQLRGQIARLIISGQLPVGTQLPAIRYLATDLGLARGTVAKVYEALARDGLVVSAGRAGTVVTPATKRAPVPKTELRQAAERIALVAHQLGLGSDEATAAVQEAFASL